MPEALRVTLLLLSIAVIVTGLGALILMNAEDYEGEGFDDN